MVVPRSFGGRLRQGDEPLAHESAGPVQAPFHGGERQPQEAGDPLQRHLGPVAQREDELELFRQRGHRLADPLPFLFALQRLPAGLTEDMAVFQDQLVQRRVGGAGLAAGPADRLPPRDGVQPRAEAGGVGQLRQRLERQQERLLTDILRQPRPRELPGDRCQHRRPIPQDEHVEGGDLTQQGRHDQLLVCKLLPPFDRHCSPRPKAGSPGPLALAALAAPSSTR
jgi:hypothetical protein